MQWRSCKNKLEKILKNQNDFCKVELDYFPVYDPDELSNLDANLSSRAIAQNVSLIIGVLQT